MGQSEYVILVDKDDNEVGTMEKLEAHKTGVLHRAVSVFLFNAAGEMLLQQRAAEKYHSPLLWTNTCCSHPRPGETHASAAGRRLLEEMGLVCELHYAFDFYYEADMDNGLIEHELDHIYVGYTRIQPLINKKEANDWRYESISNIRAEIAAHPERFTTWFKLIFEPLMTRINEPAH
jgi:isopentenyl-diphosphate delta-isomerase